jgi:hypothetical protein
LIKVQLKQEVPITFATKGSLPVFCDDEENEAGMFIFGFYY